MILKSFSPVAKIAIGVIFAISGFILDPLAKSIHRKAEFFTVAIMAIGGLSFLIGAVELATGRPFESLEDGWNRMPKFLQVLLTIVLAAGLFVGIAWVISALR